MKNKNLKICITIIMSFAVCSLKAQSLQQKFQKDMEARKKNVNTVVSKAKEQQAQQQAERKSEVIMPQSTPMEPNIQPVPVSQKKNEIKPQNRQEIKKPVTTKLVPTKTSEY